jgi:alpha-L-fucosidase
MARKLHPKILINNRSGLDEDLDTPEQHVTASQPGRGWESCMTIGDSYGWGYIRNSSNMKTVPQLLQYLCDAATGEGNFLLNCGPQPDGTIRTEEARRLKSMGTWLQKHGEAIYGSERCNLSGGMIGYWTRKMNDGYLIIHRWPGETATVPLVATRAIEATLLTTGQAVKITQEYNGRLLLSGLPKTPPDPYSSVIRVRFEKEPRSIAEKDKSFWLDGKAR